MRINKKAMKTINYKTAIVTAFIFLLYYQYVAAQQYIRINLSDGQAIEVAISEVEKITFDIPVHLLENHTLLQQLSKLKLHPNPAGQYVSISYEVEEAGEVTLSLFDINGNLILFDAFGSQPKGSHSHKIDVSGLTAGTYICILKSSHWVAHEKIIVKP